jgi:hypothetical protein
MYWVEDFEFFNGLLEIRLSQYQIAFFIHKIGAAVSRNWLVFAMITRAWALLLFLQYFHSITLNIISEQMPFGGISLFHLVLNSGSVKYLYSRLQSFQTRFSPHAFIW